MLKKRKYKVDLHSHTFLFPFLSIVNEKISCSGTLMFGTDSGILVPGVSSSTMDAIVQSAGAQQKKCIRLCVYAHVLFCCYY